MDNTNSKEYWENYTDYWVQRVSTTNDKSVKKDRTLEDALLGKYLRELGIESKHKFLDFGCGFCRLYPFYKDMVGNSNNNYIGIDIAESPLRIAEEKYSELTLNKQLYTYDGEWIPCNDNSFDRIVCFGVFDACQQEKILVELMRILKKNGRLLITGKNSRYFEDDDEAYVAEVNARKKGHPNYFTDVRVMLDFLEQNGMKVVDSFYFLRRGDFSKDVHLKVISEQFYEWALIVEKIQDVKVNAEDVSFSNKYSETYILKNGGEKE